MFSSNNAIADTDMEFRAVIQDVSRCRTDQLQPSQIQNTCINRFVRAFITALAVLCGAEIVALQLVSPAFAKDTNAAADAAAKDESIRMGYAKRKASVVAMLESGKRIDSENHTSHAEFATAESMLQEAEKLAAANKFAAGKDKLDRIYVLLKNTMRNMPSLKDGSGAIPNVAAKPVDDPAMIEKKKRDYEKLAGTVQTMTTALKQESEKAGVNNADVFGNVESSATEADRLAKAGNYDGAYQALDVGYHLLTKAIVKLENLKSKGGSTEKSLDAKPQTDATEPREYVVREIEASKALLAMLKHLNEDKAGGKESEIGAIKATAAEAGAALEAGDIALARNLIQDANSRSKKAIASLQATPSKLSGSATSEAAHHRNDDVVKEESIRTSYAKHKESVVILLQAGRRIDSEHQTSHIEFDTAESMLKEADALAAANKFDKGNDQLDRTYVLIKNTMRKMLSPKDEPKETHESPAPAKPRKPAR